MINAPETKLGEVAEFIRGINFKPDDVVPLGTEGSVGCMRTKNIQDELDCVDVWGVPKEFVRRDEQLLKEGDILVSSANSWNLVGKCCWIPKLDWPASFGGFVSVLRANPHKVDPRFLYRWFASSPTQALLRSFGQKTTNISNLNIERCLNLKLVLPPLPEQRRIAAILDQADALRAKRREALAELDSLTQSIFIEMFGDPVTNPKGWPVCTLEQFFQFQTGKLDSNAAIPDGAYPFFTCAKEDYRIDSYAFDCEALLLAGNNANADYSVKHYNGKFNAYQRTYVITLKNPQHSYRYSAFFLESHLAVLKRVSKGSSTKYLTLGLLNNIRIPVPPPALQHKFGEQIETINQARASYIKSQGEMNYLFTSLQHRAFRGEL